MKINTKQIKYKKDEKIEPSFINYFISTIQFM